LGISHEVSVKIITALNKAADVRSQPLAFTEGHVKWIRGGRQKANTPTAAPSATPGIKEKTAQEYEKEAYSYLTPTQKKRLEQIGIQRGWPFVFEDTTLARRVGVSPKQMAQYEPVFDREFKRYVRGVQQLMRARTSWYGKLDRKRYAWKYTAYDKEYKRLGERRFKHSDLALRRALTHAQIAKWHALVGKPFRQTDFRSDVKPIHLD
jgi:hypothetical protein